MLEPISGLVLPDEWVSLRAKWLPDRPTLELVILPEVFTDSVCQNNIAFIAGRLAQDGGFRLLTVEGTHGPIKPTPLAPEADSTVETLLRQNPAVSAGVLNLLRTAPNPPEVWGVDDELARRDQRDANFSINGVRHLSAAFFDRVQAMLAPAKDRIYPRAAREFQAAVTSKASLSAQANALVKGAQQAGIVLDAYPLLRNLVRIAVLERGLDTAAAEAQRTELISTVVDRGLGWWKLTAQNVVTFDLRTLGPVANLWARKTGRSARAVETEIEVLGDEALLECRRWFQHWLLEGACNARAGRGGLREYLEDLVLLGLGCGLDVLRFRELRRQLCIMRLTERLDLDQLDEERAVCSEKIMDGLCQDALARSLLELDRCVALLSSAFRLELSPRDADRFLVTDVSLRSLADRVCRFLTCLPATLPVDPQLDARASDVRNYFLLSVQRGQQMLQQSVSVAQQHNHKRVILVCGGFHLGVVVKHLEDRYPDIARSVLTPRMTVPSAGS
jgi:hypothetical protein